MIERAERLSVVVLLFVVLAGHVSLFPRVADLDGFYHIGHAAAYLEGSLLDPSLPWATQSIIREHGADLWWGFHAILTPFALFDDPVVGIRLAALLLTAAIGLTVHWTLRRHGVPHAAWWAAGFLIAVPNVFYRFLMLRPHVLSLAASLALLSVLVRGRWWQVLLLSAAISWLHVTLFWVAPGLVIAYALVRVPAFIASEPAEDDRAVPLLAAVGAVAVGTALGWALRPNPMGTLALLNVQLVRLFTQKASEEPMLFAGELLPIGLPELLRTTWLFMGLWLAAAVATARGVMTGRGGRPGLERTTLLVAATAVSVVFLVLAIVSARRAMVQWAAFGFITLPLVWSFVVGAEARRRWGRVLAVALAAYVAWGAWRHTVNVRLVAFPANTLAEAGRFLEANSEPGDIVFHARWDNFGPLFAHNRTNRYLGGMDPIFQYAHDARAYWEFFYMSADINVEWTCDAFPCADGVATDSYQVLRDHFGARWIVVEPRRNPRLSLHLLGDSRFALALETQHSAVFEILSDAREPGS